MKLFKKLNLGLLSAILLLPACAQLAVQDTSTARQIAQYQSGDPQQYCDAGSKEACYMGLSNHRPVRTEPPKVSITVSKSAFVTSKCLAHQLQTRFKLPPEFMQITAYPDGGQTVAMINPFTHVKGVQMDVINQNLETSRIDLYASNMTLSQAWLSLPSLCH